MSVFEENDARFRAKFGFTPRFKLACEVPLDQLDASLRVHCELQRLARCVAEGKVPPARLAEAIEVAATCLALPQAQSWNGNFEDGVEQLIRSYLEAARSIDSDAWL